jgi:hypothetical protein
MKYALIEICTTRIFLRPGPDRRILYPTAKPLIDKLEPLLTVKTCSCLVNRLEHVDFDSTEFNDGLKDRIIINGEGTMEYTTSFEQYWTTSPDHQRHHAPKE